MSFFQKQDLNIVPAFLPGLAAPAHDPVHLRQPGDWGGGALHRLHPLP